MIYCCNGCVPPKRNGYCHTYCEEYLAEKAEHERQKAVDDQKRDVKTGLIRQTFIGVEKANRAKRKMKGRVH